MFDLQDLMSAFSGRETFAWEILYSEMQLQGSTALRTESIKSLIELYSIGMERLNQLQQAPSNYFKTKINELMGQKRVIRCLNQEKDSHLSEARHPQKQNQIPTTTSLPSIDLLQSRKREMQIRLAYDIESSSDRLSSIINQREARENEIQRMVHTFISSEQQKLETKIRQRQRRIESSRTIKQLSTIDCFPVDSNCQINCFQPGQSSLQITSPE